MHLLGRRWNVSTDDVPIPAGIMAMFHLGVRSFDFVEAGKTSGLSPWNVPQLHMLAVGFSDLNICFRDTSVYRFLALRGLRFSDFSLLPCSNSA
jgi:hypothetical protein